MSTKPDTSATGRINMFSEFMQLESAGGILLLCTAIVAIVIANTPFSIYYDALLDTTVAVQISGLIINKPLLLWINDGLMAIFFFLIGLEIKREILEGELSSASQVVLPAVGAIGGMVVPAGIYAAFNWGNDVAMDGWAIPVATDIAFALALLGAFGSRVPTALKIFLMTLAIFDDLAAIVIIAIFYSADLSTGALGIGLGILLIAFALNRTGITKLSAYIFLGILLWIAVLKSGVHATLAGVLIAFCVPMRDQNGNSPLRELEHDLHGPVAFAILPVFAFGNAGLTLSGITMDDLFSPITVGVIAGLTLGKPIGILACVGIAVALKLVELPRGVSWGQILGVSFACGIGFTMSLFIAGLAFEHGSGEYFAGDRLGILIGSLISAIAAFVVLSLCLPERAEETPDSGEASLNKNKPA